MRPFFILCKFELKKILEQKTVMAMSMLLLVIFVYLGTGWQDNRNHLLNDLTGTLTQKKYQIVNDLLKIAEEKQESGDETKLYISELDREYSADEIIKTKAQMDYILNNSANRNNILERAQQNISRCENDNEKKYFLQYNQKIYNHFLNAPDLVLMDTEGFQIAFPFFCQTIPFNYADLMFAIFFIVCLCGVFAKEYESKVVFISHASRYGRKTLFWSKLFSATLFIFLSIAFFLAVWLTAISTKFNMGNFFAPIQSIHAFENCPYNITILQYLFIIILSKTAFFVLLFLVFSIVGIVARHRFHSLAVGILFFGIFFGSLFDYADKMSQMTSYSMERYCEWTSLYNFGSLSMNINQYFENFDYINFFGYPISKITILISICCIFLLLSILLCKLVYCGFGKSWDRSEKYITKKI